MSRPRRSAIALGARESLPLGIALSAVGLAFGYTAHLAGLEWWAVGLMSLLVYGGPSQFLAVGLIAAGAPVPTIIITTFVANLRYSLFAASLAPHLRDTPHKRLLGLAQGLADGSYALTLQYAARHPKRPRKDLYLLGSVLVSYGVWVPSSIAGALVGDSLPGAIGYGLGFATPAIFTAFLVSSVTDGIGVGVVLVAGLGAIAGRGLLPSGTAPVVAIVTAATLGGALQWRRQRS